MLTTSEFLDKMITLFQQNDWNRLRFALDEYGDHVPSISPKACSFCLAGAMARISYEHQTPETEVYRAIVKIIKPMNYEYVSDFNDGYLNTKEEAIQFLERVRNEAS